MGRMIQLVRHIRDLLTMDSLSRRLSVFLMLLVCLLFACVLCLLFLFNTFSSSPDSLKSSLKNSADEYAYNVRLYFSDMAAQGIRMSGLITDETEKLLTHQGVLFDMVRDNQALIELLEERSYGILNNTLHTTNCSGVYVIFDTTVNSKLPDSKQSRSGIFLRYENISGPRQTNSSFAWVRGIHSIGARYCHVFHNKWELEFAIDRLPFYKKLMQAASPSLSGCYFYPPLLKLKGTWEKIMLLCVPMVGKSGQFYGICGLEISAMYFKLKHLSDKNGSLRATGLLARRQNGCLLPATGLESGTASGYFVGLGASPMRIEPFEDGLSRYTSKAGSFIGKEQTVRLSPLDGSAEWSIAYFIPEEDYKSIVHYHYLKIASFCLLFLCIALLFSFYIGRLCVRPVLQRIESITNGSSDKTSIVEIDELINFLAKHHKEQAAMASQADLSGFFNFKKNIETLSNAERAVFDLYLEGYSSQEVADKLFISINTVKSHNRRIYKKLDISSKKELMLFAKMYTKDAKEDGNAGEEGGSTDDTKKHPA